MFYAYLSDELKYNEGKLIGSDFNYVEPNKKITSDESVTFKGDKRSLKHSFIQMPNLHKVVPVRSFAV